MVHDRETSKVLYLEHRLVVCWNFDIREVFINILEVLKCGAGEGWTGQFRPVTRKIECYKELRRKEASYI